MSINPSESAESPPAELQHIDEEADIAETA
jgi:hypothetical protein